MFHRLRLAPKLVSKLASPLTVGGLICALATPTQAGLLAPGPLMATLTGAEGYAYGYPLVLMAETLAGMTGPTRACGFEGGVNDFFHVFNIPGPDFRAVVRPNVDTLYSSAFLDLSKGPQLLDMPAVPGRYVLMALLDAWSNNFAGLGTPSHGEQAGHYMIAGPGWTGATPAGYTRVDAPTNLVWIIGRTEVRDADDVATVNAIQRQYTLSPLSGVRLPPDTSPCITRDESGTPPAIVNRLPAVDYFSRLSTLIAQNPPPAADEPMLRKLATIGVGPYATRTVSDMPARTQLGLEWGKSMAQTTARLGLKLMGKTAPWTPDPSKIPLGDYGQQYMVRYVVAQIGFGANRNDLAVYQNAIQDGQRKALNGANQSYTITFPAGQLPPVDAFWSITVYDEDGYLVANDLHRHALNSFNKLHTNPDGSLTLHLSHQAPTGAATAAPISNWLPIPAGPFEATVRLYGPKAPVLDGSWTMPPIQPE